MARDIPRIVIYGTSKMSDLLFNSWVENRDNNFYISGWTCDKQYVKADTFHELPLIEFDSVETKFPPDKYKMLIALSGSNMRYRKSCFENAKAKGYDFVNYISSRSIISRDLQIGVNNIIFESVYIAPFGKIGDNNIIRQNTYIGHDHNIGSHNIICPGCNIAGYVTVKDLCFIGIGATIVERNTVEDETLIGAGSVVIKSTEKYSLCVGNPARKIKSHEDTGIIL